jgi:hypothetical protein
LDTSNAILCEHQTRTGPATGRCRFWGGWRRESEPGGASDDESKARGFSVQQLGKKAVTVTNDSFKDTHDLTIALKPGQWFFYSPGVEKTSFVVVA